jgi:hypothetical protein
VPFATAGKSPFHVEHALAPTGFRTYDVTLRVQLDAQAPEPHRLAQSLLTRRQEPGFSR